MEEIIKKLEETDKIYDVKLDDAIKALNEMDVKDEQFDKLLNSNSVINSIFFDNFSLSFSTSFISEIK